MNYQIGLSGMNVAQRGIELVGTNITNASTPEYHRQVLEVVPDEYLAYPKVSLGGAMITGSKRCIDILVEKEILHQRVASGQINKELSTLSSLQGVFGDVDTQGLGLAIQNFFDSLKQLSTQPDQLSLQTQAVYAAQNMAEQFQGLATYFSQMDSDIQYQAESKMAQVNQLLQNITDYNQQIRNMEARGSNANLLADKRDQAIAELGNLADVATSQPDPSSNVVNVWIWGMPATIGSEAMQFEVGLVNTSDGIKMGISVEGQNYYNTDYRGGEIGALMALKNDLLPSYKEQLDTLAAEIIDQVNHIQVQGLGSSGSFTEMFGTILSSSTTALVDMGLGIGTGTVYLRETDASGSSTVHSFTIGTSTTLSDVINAINLFDPGNLQADSVGNALHITTTSSGYTFDFLPESETYTTTPAIPPESPFDPTPLAAPNWTGTASPAVSGVYTGDANEIYTCTLIGGVSGDVGITPNMKIEIRDHLNNVVKTVDVGLGYAEGTPIDIGNGLTISLSAGSMVAGENFAIRAMADSDPINLWAPLGMNIFFTGSSSDNITVKSEFLSDPGRLATARGPDLADNINVLKMADLADTALVNLGGKTPDEYYRNTVMELGEDIALRQAKKDSQDVVMQAMQKQREDVSGVDINEQTVQMMMYEKMFQGMAKFISALDTSFQAMLNMIR